MAWTWGQQIQGTTDYDQNAQMRELFALQGQKAGEWQTDPKTGAKYIDTPYGRVNDNTTGLMAMQARGNDVSDQDMPGNKAWYDAGNWKGTTTGTRYANQNGSDLFQIQIDENGVYQRPRMNRQSNRDMNFALAGMAGIAGAAYLGAGAAAGGAGGGGGGAAAGAGAVESSVVPLTAAEYGSMGGAGAATSAGGGLVSGYDTAGLDSIIEQQSAQYASSSSDYWSRLLGNGQVVGGLIAGIGQGAAAYMSGRDQLENSREQRNFLAAEAEKERQWKVRNMNIQNMPKITWG